LHAAAAHHRQGALATLLNAAQRAINATATPTEQRTALQQLLLGTSSSRPLLLCAVARRPFPARAFVNQRVAAVLQRAPRRLTDVDALCGCVDALLAAGVDPTARDTEGLSVLHRAVQVYCCFRLNIAAQLKSKPYRPAPTKYSNIC
jgi:hypothetical protein